MLSPFPGMDPYVEQPVVWSKLYGAVFDEMRRTLALQFISRYEVHLTAYTTYDTVDITRPPSLALGAAPPPLDAPPNTPKPIENTVDLDMPVRLQALEILVADTHELVTAIEFLAPLTKCTDHPAWQRYQHQRRNVLRSQTHLLELDLLRAGERMPLQSPRPPAHYYVTLSRAERRPKVEVWPINFWDRLPVVPVPLRAPDADVALDLNTLIPQMYEWASLGRWIDYRQAPPLPHLTEAEEAWLDQHLKAQGRR